jgi:hypothetical protein
MPETEGALSDGEGLTVRGNRSSILAGRELQLCTNQDSGRPGRSVCVALRGPDLNRALSESASSCPLSHRVEHDGQFGRGSGHIAVVGSQGSFANRKGPLEQGYGSDRQAFIAIGGRKLRQSECHIWVPPSQGALPDGRGALMFTASRWIVAKVSVDKSKIEVSSGHEVV